MPFFSFRGNAFALARSIARGNLPHHPGSPATDRGLTPDCWDLLQHCWNVRSSERPSADYIVKRVRDLQYVSSISLVPGLIRPSEMLDRCGAYFSVTPGTHLLMVDSVIHTLVYAPDPPQLMTSLLSDLSSSLNIPAFSLYLYLLAPEVT